MINKKVKHLTVKGSLMTFGGVALQHAKKTLLGADCCKKDKVEEAISAVRDALWYGRDRDENLDLNEELWAEVYYDIHAGIPWIDA